MANNLLHQCGYHAKWNIDSLLQDGCGTGLILSPVHQRRATVESLSAQLRESSLFDPQYYLPNSQKPKLASYDFFPETIADGFSTANFAQHAFESAQRCIAFQLEQGFRALIVPTRYYDQMLTDFVERQNTYTVHPFIEAIQNANSDKPVYLALVLTAHMMKDEQFRTHLLNWATSFPDVDGIYLIPDIERDTKQIADADALFALLKSVHEMRTVKLDVIVGYSNTESLLLSMIDGTVLTCGSFENTRIFSVDKFVELEEERRGPRARVYLQGLLNWIQYPQAREIKDSAPEIWKQIYSPTEYGDKALKAAVEPTFNQPGLYKHHFECLNSQLDILNSLSARARYERLRDWILRAQESYAALSRERFDFERHGRGDFLDGWLSAINRYASFARL